GCSSGYRGRWAVCVFAAHLALDDPSLRSTDGDEAWTPRVRLWETFASTCTEMVEGGRVEDRATRRGGRASRGVWVRRCRGCASVSNPIVRALEQAAQRIGQTLSRDAR